ncbi:MAG: hybrid sensor histidine kinase/response regulator [Rikenellaceae bacterium]|nr:hybrid sensor histidine kinase/response regulator [Rikenellaceae bacterium]
MARSYERTIRWKAIGIYMFIAVICIAVSSYIYGLSRNVSSQRHHIENYYDLLRVTNRVTFSVSDAQSTANLYLTSKNRSHLVSFGRKVSETETLVDSLTLLSRLTGDTSNLESLKEITGLLRRKGEIIQLLSSQLVSYNPVDSIADRIFYDDVPGQPVINDSVFLLGDRKNLLDVMSNVFVPERYRDSLITAYSLRPQTGQTVREDSIKIAAEVRQYVEQVRTGYSSNLREVERQINRMMRTDQEISAQIIDVLNNFHRRTMLSTIRNIEQSEETIQKNYRYSLGGIGISLLLITVLVILIISDANKGQSSRLALERANTRIREIMASRHKLLLSVSHDIKTPLGAMLGYLELWKEGNCKPEEISAAELSGKHIGALINNLLEFSSLQQGISRPSPQPFDLASFCEETAGMIRPQASKKGLEFETAFDLPSGRGVEADPMRLRQIVLNLLSNAVKYTPEGKVTFMAGYTGGRIRFCISDTGSGMGPEELEGIFRPFSRLDSNRTMAEGHGYGMYVVKGLVELLEGEIKIDSSPGNGTTVKVSVPAPEVNPRDFTDGILPAKRILFVDDDATLLKVLSSLAVTLGHSVEVSSDPDSIATGDIDLSRFDVIVTDMEMGNRRGTDILALAKKSASAARVVLMSGHHDMNRIRAIEMGFDGYIAKPVTLEALESAIDPGGAPQENNSVLASSIAGMFTDKEMLEEIMETFMAATREDLRSLRSAMFRRDHRKVREISHRMLPLLRQFGAAECGRLLESIHGASPQTAGRTGYWKEVGLFIEACSKFVEGLEKP